MPCSVSVEGYFSYFALLCNVKRVMGMDLNNVITITFTLSITKTTARQIHTRGVQKVLQIDIQKIHKALEFYFI